MSMFDPRQSRQSLLSLPNRLLQSGLEIRVDPRLACLAAGVTTATSPFPSEHELVTTTRNALSRCATHPSVRWLRKALKGMWMLNLAMRTVQLGNPPTFLPYPAEEIPHFVSTYFAEPPPEKLSQHLAAIWGETPLPTLLEAQIPLWNEVVNGLVAVLESIDLVTFQRRFFGTFPYHPVVVPLANLALIGEMGMGPANRSETYAICCLTSAPSYQANVAQTLELVQHESSHPVLADIVQRHPSVPAACAFVEERLPPSSHFAEIYPRSDFHWHEVVIRAASWFFFQEIGRPLDGDTFLQEQCKHLPAVKAYIAALTPWWRERRAGYAPGLNDVLNQLPSWLRR